MAKAVGRITLPEERQDTLRSMLMWHYHENVEFWEDWAPLLYRYERLIEALVRPLDRRPRHDRVGLFADEDKAWQALDAAIDSGPVETKVGGERRVSTTGREYMVRESRNTHLRRYREELKDLCNTWGLRCEWAPLWIHASYVGWVHTVMSAEELDAEWDQVPPSAQTAILRIAPRHTWRSLKQLRCRFRRWVQQEGQDDLPAATLLPGRDEIVEGWRLVDERFEEAHKFRLRHVRSFGRREGDPHIRIDIPYDPWPRDDWEDLEKVIVKEARRQRDEIRALYLRAGFTPQYAQPDLARHVSWLYLHICPQPETERPLRWTEIANRAYVEWRSVKKEVVALASKLGIALAPGAHGRPPKYPA